MVGWLEFNGEERGGPLRSAYLEHAIDFLGDNSSLVGVNEWSAERRLKE